MRAAAGRALRALAVPMAGLLALAGCVPPQNAGAPSHPPAEHVLSLVPTPFAQVPGWQDDHLAEALATFLGNCRALAALPVEQQLGGQGMAATRAGAPALWRPACEAAKGVPAGDDAAARAFFEAQLDAYAVTDTVGAGASAGRAEGLFTGYFDPEVPGARSPGGKYRTALLGRPGDLIQVDLGEFSDDLKGRAVSGRVQDGHLVPYYDRTQIEGGALARRRLELLWLADPVDAYFLQVQGSGRVNLPDGHVVRVTYAGQNGRRSVLIGKVLLDRGLIPRDQISMQSIRAWLDAHPDQMAEVLNQNPSYVFFREVDGLRPDQGPPGALGVPLTPGRSVAVDRAFIPLGAPVFVVTTDPVTKAPLRRLTVAQDVGGAIRGPVRTDFFFGWGAEAEDRAGRMRQPGTEYLLLPKPAAANVTAALP